MKNRIHRTDAEHAEIPQRLAGHATSLRYLCLLCVSAVILVVSLRTFAQQLPREQWGAPPVDVSQSNAKWTIACAYSRFGFMRVAGARNHARKFDGKSLFPLVRRAARHYHDDKFGAKMSKIPGLDQGDRERLLTGE